MAWFSREALLRRLNGALVLGVAGLVAFQVFSQWRRRGFDNPTGTPALPDFQLTERSGRSVGPADLRDRVWVAGFIFTRCKGPCPFLSRRMAQLQEKFRETADFRLVSFSVDPAHDTPEVLSAYATRFGADPDRWWFLTGSPEKVHSIIREGFGLGLKAPPRGSDQVAHSTRMALVDRGGTVRGYFDGTETRDLRRLESELRRLLS